MSEKPSDFERTLKLLRYTRKITFEACTECNLSELHRNKCPNSSSERYKYLDTTRPVDDEHIIAMASEACNKMSFRGYIGWHYYNEPCLVFDRIEFLMKQIRKHVPRAKFILWTNGTCLPRDLNRLRIFSRVVVTNYFNRDFSFIRDYVKSVAIINGKLDNRMNQSGNYNRRRCLRVFSALVIDYYGNSRLCCMDWKGVHGFGNVHTSTFADIVYRHVKMRDMLAREPLSQHAPQLCLSCRHKGGSARRASKVAADSMEYIAKPNERTHCDDIA